MPEDSDEDGFDLALEATHGSDVVVIVVPVRGCYTLEVPAASRGIA